MRLRATAGTSHFTVLVTDLVTGHTSKRPSPKWERASDAKIRLASEA